jgi:photosystem II PsbU protein
MYQIYSKFSRFYLFAHFLITCYCALLFCSYSTSIHRYRTVYAFAPVVQRKSTKIVISAVDSRREFFSTAAIAAAGVFGVVGPANAIRDYENVQYLGGSSIIDINNANVRAYIKLQGLYPTVAGKIASNGPYKAVSDLYNIPGLSGAEKDLIKKYEPRFVAKEPSADYVIDRINNGL